MYTVPAVQGLSFIICPSKTAISYNMIYSQNFEIFLRLFNVYLCCFSEGSQVRVYRYIDPSMGPRTLPVFNEPECHKTLVDPSATFNVDLKNHTVNVQENGKTFDIGSQMAYIVN